MNEINPSLMTSLAGDSGIWLGSMTSYFSAQSSLSTALSMDAATLKLYYDDDDDEEDGKYGMYGYMVQDLADGVVGVHINGTLVNQYRPWNRFFGLVSYEEIINAMSVAAESGPSDIVQMIKSPGGAAQGISEASDHIEAIQKSGIRVSTHSGSIMASGGYWFGVNGSPLWASKMAEVGSVGVISVHMEYTRMLEQMGIKPTVMRTSEYKALGTPYEKFTEKAQGEHERRMQDIHDLFVGHVADKRGMAESAVSANIATGQVFLGREALQIGAIDQVGTLEGLIQHLSSGRRTTHSTMTHGDDPMKRRILSDGQQAQLDAAIAAGASPEQALSLIDTNGDGDAAADDNSAEDKVEDTAIESELSDEPTGDEGEEEPQDKPESEPKVDSSAVAALSAQVESLQQKVIDLSVSNAQLKTEATNASAALPALTQFASAMLERMEIGLNRATTPTEGMTAQSLAELCVKVNKEFCERFSVGSKSAESENSDSIGPAPTNPMQHHLANVTAIGQKQ